MAFVDDFVIPVPTAKREDYIKAAEVAAKVFKEFGATQVVECWGVDVPDGVVTSFTMAVNRKEDESVVFSWVGWPSRQVRDEGMKKVMEDALMINMDAPFDGKRMIFGGFETIAEA